MPSRASRRTPVLLLLSGLCLPGWGADYQFAPVADQHGVASFSVQEATHLSNPASGRGSLNEGAAVSLDGKALRLAAPLTFTAGVMLQPGETQAPANQPFAARMLPGKLPFTCVLTRIDGEPARLEISRAEVWSMAAEGEIRVGQAGKPEAAPLVYPWRGQVVYQQEDALPAPRLIVGIRCRIPGADAGQAAVKDGKPRAMGDLDVRIDLIGIQP